MKKKLFTILMMITLCLTLIGCCSETNNKKTSIEKELPINELWGKLKGFWSEAENKEFVCFSYNEMQESYYAGIWNAGVGRGAGTVKKSEYQQNGIYKLTVYYAADPGNEIDGPYEELTTTVVIDISDIENNKVIVNDNDTGNITYILSGRTYEEATKKISN